MRNIVQILESRAQSQPDRLLFGFLNVHGDITDAYTACQFQRRINCLAAQLAARGAVEADQPILLVYPPGLEFAAAFYACAKLGAIPVPVPPPSLSGSHAGLERLAHIATDSGATVALTDRSMQRRLRAIMPGGSFDFSPLRACGVEALIWLATDEVSGALDSFETVYRETLFLQYTSGSTREPRGVVVTHDNIIHNCALALDHEAPIGVSWLPHFHDMGLIGYYLWSVVRGGSAYCFSPLDFLRRPVLWLQAIAKYKATISTAPNFAFDYCLRRDKVSEDSLAGLDLSSLRQLVNAAEPVRAASANRFLDRYARCGLDPAVFTAAFGLAEHTLCVTAGGRVQIDVNKRLMERNRLRVETAPGDPVRTRRLVSCGKPRPDVHLRIVDPAMHTAKGKGEVGEIWVDSPSKAAGYWRQPDFSKPVFQATLKGEESIRTYLRTGDMGFVHDGELFVCGRLKDMIVVRGQNIFPNDVEAAVETAVASHAFGPVVVFGVETDGACDGVAVLIETRAKGQSRFPGELIGNITQACEVPVMLTALVPRGSIVRTSSGKISRALTKRHWLGGRIKPVEVHEAQNFARTVRTADECLEDIFRIAARLGGDETTLEQLGLDSFELVTLSLHLEEFIEAHGLQHHQLAIDVNDLRIIQSITVGQLRALAEEFNSGFPNLAKIGLLSARAIHDVTKDEDDLMRRDSVLPNDIAPHHRHTATGDAIFMTGATGFLGAYLLEALIRLTDRAIYVLVRCRDEDHGRNRIEAALLEAGALETAVGGLWRRVTLVPGDLAQPRLGLSDKTWDKIAFEVSDIYHCGAEVDYVKSYRAMRDANVGGTREILRLTGTGPPKRLHHVSTTFIFGWCALPVLYERVHTQGMEDRDFGYSQTKWVAEQLVYQAIERGLDAKIYRSSLVTASRSGHYMRGDIVARILGYMIRHGISTHAQNQMSFLPVDHCAQNIAAVSLRDDLEPDTFHVTTDHHYAIADVCEIITQQFGYRFDYTSMDGFVAHMNDHCGPDDELYPLKPFITKHIERVNRMQEKRYDNRNYRLARRCAVGALDEPPLADVAEWIVRFLQNEALVPLPPARGLAGRAAVRVASPG